MFKDFFAYFLCKESKGWRLAARAEVPPSMFGSPNALLASAQPSIVLSEKEISVIYSVGEKRRNIRYGVTR